jgi:hypothetical protein
MVAKDTVRGIVVVVALALLIPCPSLAAGSWGLVGAVIEGVNKGLELDSRIQDLQINEQQIELQNIEIERQRLLYLPLEIAFPPGRGKCDAADKG